MFARPYPECTVPGKTKTCVDNPEYIMNSEQREGELGIPIVDPPHSRPFPCQKSSEEESDHEYYNDIDRLERERQPLTIRRNETTV